MKCPECGEDIKFEYIVPTKSYKIEDGKISRDDAWEGPAYDQPYLDFHCSNDKEHDIDTSEINEWADQIEKLFYETVMPS
jgi:hypothetical protein